MLENYLRPTLQSIIIEPIASSIDRFTTIKPHSVTLFACIMGILSGILIPMGFPIGATVFLLLSGFLDILDGTMARIQQQSTPLGSVCDIVGDRIVEFSVVLGLFYVNPMHRGGLCCWILGSILLCMTSFLVVGMFIENHSNKSFHYSPGLIERFEAFVFFVAMILLPQWFSALAILFSALVFLTAGIRLYQFYQQSLLNENSAS